LNFFRGCIFDHEVSGATIDEEAIKAETDGQDDDPDRQRKERSSVRFVGALFKKKETPKKEDSVEEVTDGKADDSERKREDPLEGKGDEKKDEQGRDSEKKKRDEKGKEPEKKENIWKNLFGKKRKAPLRTVTAEESLKNEQVLVADAAKAPRRTFADEVQTLIKRWSSASKEMAFEEFNSVMAELGFNDVFIYVPFIALFLI
jgi:hypothetical protein